MLRSITVPLPLDASARSALIGQIAQIEESHPDTFRAFDSLQIVTVSREALDQLHAALAALNGDQPVAVTTELI